MDTAGGLPSVKPDPAVTKIIDKTDDLIVDIHQLSLDFTSTRETEGEDEDGAVYHMMCTRRSGAITVSTLADLLLLRHSCFD